MLLEDFGIAFALLAQKLFQCKIELNHYFDYNDIQKPEGEDPICFWARRASPLRLCRAVLKKKSIHCHVLTQSQ